MGDSLRDAVRSAQPVPSLLWLRRPLCGGGVGPHGQPSGVRSGLCFKGVLGRGGGSGTQKFVDQKWPEQMFPMVMGRAPTQSPWGFVRVS